MEEATKISVECPTCNATGLGKTISPRSFDFNHPGPAGIVCTDCYGSGCVKLEPFKTKRVCPDIKLVYASYEHCGYHNIGIKPVGPPLPYKDFLKGQRPKHEQPTDWLR